MAEVHEYKNWSDFIQRHGVMPLWAFSTRGKYRYDQVNYATGGGLLFGPESRGLPGSLLDTLGEERVLRLPMQANSRSLNLSNTVAIVLYEALRQRGFAGLA
jgi:tRNA(Leu) C34 or U34 (ribose-2'-O)-methylase TrmL